MVLSMNIEYKENILSANDYLMFIDALDEYKATKEQTELSIANQVFSVTALNDGKAVGMARLLGDKATYWIITDVLILPDYQRKGIGSELTKRLIHYIKENAPKGEHLVFLLCNKGKENFYRKLGFTELPTNNEGPGMAMEIEIS